MKKLQEFDIRLFDTGGALRLSVPAMVESENIARMKAGVLCSQLGLETFDVRPAGGSVGQPLESIAPPPRALSGVENAEHQFRPDSPIHADQ